MSIRINVSLIESNIQQRAHFSGGSFGNEQESSKISIRIALESFSNIGHDRYARPLQLIAQAEVLRKTTPSVDAVKIPNKLTCIPPGLNVFESGNRRHCRPRART